MEQEKPSIAFFDFDGTITTHDTFIEFLKFHAGKGKFYLGFMLLSPLLVAYKLKLYPNDKAKEAVLTFFFKGMTAGHFYAQCKAFCTTILPGLIKSSALRKIDWHRAQGHHVHIVSASIEDWIKPWADQQGIPLIATGMEIRDEVITGKLSTPNCYGPEKVRRIQELFSLKDYVTVYAYGDSGGDKEMLAMADEPFFRVFHD